MRRADESEIGKESEEEVDKYKNESLFGANLKYPVIRFLYLDTVFQIL